MFYIVTGRFNNQTLEDNYEYRRKHNYRCIYCCPSELSPKISYNSSVFVIEMNNSTNKIEGIGFIKNKTENKRYYKVHKEGNTNRFIYIGNYFISREILNRYNEELVFVLENLLFKGYTHSKRGNGLTLFPEKLYNSEKCNNIDIKNEIKNIFTTYFNSNREYKNNEETILEEL